MSAIFTSTRRVEFHDTDAAGIMHFSAFFTFMEEAEHELLRNLGLSVVMREGEHTISWPRISASCDFQRPIKFEDVIEIEVSVARLGEKSVTYSFRFLQNEETVAVGSMASVCCRIDGPDAPQSILIPEFIAEKLREFNSV